MSSKIGIYEFNLMPLGEQADYLWDNGAFIANSLRDGLLFKLYILHNFYVEVVYKDEVNRIIELKPFKTTRLLEPYLDSIDLDKLV